jgi:hypothetical protein
MVVAGTTVLTAQGKEEKPKKAKETVDRIRQADPPKAEKPTKTVKEKVVEAKEQTKRQDQANAHNSGRKTDLQTAPPPAPKKEEKKK